MVRNLLTAILLGALAGACGGTIDSFAGGDGGPTSDSENGSGRVEICGNHLDDDGNGEVDEGCACDPEKTPEQWCYLGKAGTQGIGACKVGVQRCIKQDEFSSWGACEGSVGPKAEICDDGVDNDCNGAIDDCPQDEPDAGVPGPGAADSGAPEPAAPCGPQNCSGCCDYNGVCHEVPTQSFCALGGALCVPCNAMQYCNAPTGSCEWLKLGEDLISVIAASAMVADTGACGMGDSCDPYAVVKIGDRYGETSTDYGDPSAVWNDFLFNIDREVLISQPLKVTIKDQDSLLRGSDDRLAECSVQVTNADLQAGRLQFSCSNKVPNVILTFQD